MPKITDEELDNRFTYHSPIGDQPERYELLQSKARELAHMIRNLCPEGRETAKALTDLQQAVMWAKASIACGRAYVPLSSEGFPALNDHTITMTAPESSCTRVCFKCQGAGVWTDEAGVPILCQSCAGKGFNRIAEPDALVPHNT